MALAVLGAGQLTFGTNHPIQPCAQPQSLGFLQ